MTTIDRDETRRRAQGAIDAERRTAIGPFTFNKARPVLAPREVLDLLDAIDQAEHRATRAEAQSETRRLDMEYWRERAEGFEVAEEQLLLRNRNLLDAHREAEARIQAVRDVLAHHPYGGPDQEDAVRRALDAP